MSDPLLTISNHHIAQSGDPPIVTNDDAEKYIGYFENCHGEQWIFTFDRDTKEAELRGGDIGWNDRHEVREGKVEGLVLDSEELRWLRACWVAATGA